jgi:uncharacterized protein YggE
VKCTYNVSPFHQFAHTAQKGSAWWNLFPHKHVFIPNSQWQIHNTEETRNMKGPISLKHLFVVALLAVALVGCTVAKAGPPVEAQGAPADESPSTPRYITVVGTGRVTLKPDVAEINVGAQATAGTVSAAKAEVDRQLAAILSTLKDLGIAESDIQTSSYSIYYEREPFPPVMREGAAPEQAGGYRVSSTLRVTIRDIDAVGEVLDAVVEAGANQVYGVQFTVSDDKEWQSKARELAVADAKARAQELAGLSDVELGQVLSLSEVVGGAPALVPAMALERSGGGIAPGELELSTQVQVTFAIK